MTRTRMSSSNATSPNRDRSLARRIAREALDSGDHTGWFETLYALADGDPSIIPWADLRPNPNLVDWLQSFEAQDHGKALKIGCGLGDDAELLALNGYETTAFDISDTAIRWSRKRFPESPVTYTKADLFAAPSKWLGQFDLVVESYTLQVLPPGIRARAAQCISSFIAPGGTLLVIARGRDLNDPPGEMPWPVSKQELGYFEIAGLTAVSFEEYMDNETPPVRRFRATFQRL